MKAGSSLQGQQIVGVQRLVAAAVPGLAPERVVVTDQRGVTLSSTDASAGGAGAADARLQVKREVEDYITHKIARLLDSAFGPGQAIVSVDAVLNFDATKTTIQDLLPAGGNAAEGRIVRRRQTTGASTAEPMWTSAADGPAPVRSPSSSLDVEFEYGRRIDEIIAAPGTVTRISVGVVVPDAVSDERREKVTELVRMAAGLDERRGDAITVQPLSQLDLAVEQDTADAPPEAAASAAPQAARQTPALPAGWLLGVAASGGSSPADARSPSRVDPRTLSEEERQSILDDIQRALGEEGASTRGHARP